MIPDALMDVLLKAATQRARDRRPPHRIGPGQKSAKRYAPLTDDERRYRKLPPRSGR